MIKIIHFKQARDGAAHPTVDTGDLDCLRMQEILEAKGYNGAAIMEIPPDQNVFDNLAASYAFLELRAGVKSEHFHRTADDQLQRIHRFHPV